VANDVLLKRLECSIENITGGIGAVPSESFFCYLLLHTHADISMLPTLQRMFELNNAAISSIIGDLKTEFTPTLIRRITNEHNLETVREWIDKLVQRADVDEYVRWSLVRVMRFWVQAGLMSREDAIAQLKTWITGFGELKYDMLSAACVCEMLDLNAVEEQSFIMDCFDRGQIDESLVDRDSCLGELQLGTTSSSSDEIHDLVKYFSGWRGYTSTSLSLDPESGDLKPIEKPSWGGDEAPKESDIRQWLTAIRQSNDRNYPREAVRCLSQHASKVADRLVDDVLWGLQKVGQPDARSSNGPLIAATFLAAQRFGSDKDVLFEILDLTLDDRMDVFGDAIESSIVYALSHRLLGNCQEIDQRIDNPDRDELDRATLAMFYPLSAYHGYLTRKDCIGGLLSRLERATNEAPDLANAIYDSLCLMSVPGDHPIVSAALNQGVRNRVLSDSDARLCIETPTEAGKVLWKLTRECRIPTDAIEASVMFDKDILNPPTKPQNKRASQFDISQPVSSTIAKGADDRIPRNSPCPCGSGKKYKKCCLKV